MRRQILWGERVKTPSPSTFSDRKLRPLLPKKVDVSAYEGYIKTLEDYFDEEDWEVEEPMPVMVEKPSTYRKFNKDRRWKSEQFISSRTEQKLFQEILRDIEEVDLDEEVFTLKNIIVNSPILRTHVDLTFEFNYFLEGLRRELYSRIRKLVNKKYQTILLNKMYKLWDD